MPLAWNFLGIVTFLGGGVGRGGEGGVGGHITRREYIVSGLKYCL